MNKYFFSVLISVTLICIFLISATSPTAKKDTVVFHTADLNQAKKIIIDYAKAGYSVVSVTPQALTNTYGGRTSCSGDCQVVKGELFVVMEK